MYAINRAMGHAYHTSSSWHWTKDFSTVVSEKELWKRTLSFWPDLVLQKHHNRVVRTQCPLAASSAHHGQMLRTHLRNKSSKKWQRTLFHPEKCRIDITLPWKRSEKSLRTQGTSYQIGTRLQLQVKLGNENMCAFVNLYASLWFPVCKSVWPYDMIDKDVWYIPPLKAVFMKMLIGYFFVLSKAFRN